VGYTNVAYVDVRRYDTLVLFKGEYDPAGKLTDSAAKERAALWRERSLNALSQAATRRDQAKAVIERTRAEAKRIEAEADAAEAAKAAARAAALSGGIPGQGLAPPVTAALPADQQWREDLARWQDKSVPKEHVFNFGLPSEQLSQAGFPERDIRLTQRVLGKRALPISSLLDLPARLRDPIAVF
jgi:hypothetical protein